jgi:hypothetical protein
MALVLARLLADEKFLVTVYIYKMQSFFGSTDRSSTSPIQLSRVQNMSSVPLSGGSLALRQLRLEVAP